MNVQMYEFLKENETGMFLQGSEVIGYVHVYFFNLDEFVSIVGEEYFDEGGLEVQLFKDTVCIELNDIIEGEGHSLLSYKNCFGEFDLERFEKELATMA